MMFSMFSMTASAQEPNKLTDITFSENWDGISIESIEVSFTPNGNPNLRYMTYTTKVAVVVTGSTFPKWFWCKDSDVYTNLANACPGCPGTMSGNVYYESAASIGKGRYYVIYSGTLTCQP